MLFKQFGKLLRTADMNHEGIGMGLMICQNLVMMNDGEISVHSDGVDKGSAFYFTMKMQNPSVTKSMKKEAPTPKTCQILTGSQAEVKIEEQKTINAAESAVSVKESSSVSSSSPGESSQQDIMQNQKLAPTKLNEREDLKQVMNMEEQLNALDAMNQFEDSSRDLEEGEEFSFRTEEKKEIKNADTYALLHPSASTLI